MRPIKQEGRVRHQTAPRRDGQRRWDQAYQHLLRWARELRPGPPQQEEKHESSDLCPGLDDPAGPNADD
jgi:hypothetical protein